MFTKGLLILFLGASLSVGYSQGTVVFDTQNITTGPAKIVFMNGTGLAGAAYSAQLYSAAGDQRSNPSALTAAETRVHFRSANNAGFVAISGTNPFTQQPVDSEVTVTPTAAGPATIQLRVWDSTFSTYEAALAANGLSGASSPIFLMQTGGGLLPPVELTGLQGFMIPIIPEPSVIAFGLVGLGAFLFRKKKG